MKAVNLSARVRRSLEEIGAYSAEKFGERKGDAYVAALLARCRAVARGSAQHYPCRNFFADDLSEDLRFVRAGRHFIIFLSTTRAVLVVDFLHQSADIGNRLGDAPE